MRGNEVKRKTQKNMTTTYPVRLLWLSDIHFREVYYTNRRKYKNSVRLLIENFIKTVVSLHAETSIKILIISGDLAFSGAKGDYDALGDLLIRPLKKAISDVKIICIPGNHDVDRQKAANILDNILLDGLTLEDAFKDKENLLNQYSPHYNSLFENYSDFLIKERANEGVSELSYRLYGSDIDRANKTITYLFNTAWFCVSSSVTSSVINDLIHNQDRKSEDLKKIFYLVDNANEFGGQIIGSTLMATNEIAASIENEEFHGYTKIAILHHPFHWLKWEEMYQLTESRRSFLHKLIEQCDLVLTGHEHLPTYIRPNRIFGRPWHLQAGMFIEDNVLPVASLPKSTSFPHNRFSILDLYEERAEHTDFLFDVKASEWQKKATDRMTFARTYRAVSPKYKDSLIQKFRINWGDIVKQYFTTIGVDLPNNPAFSRVLTTQHVRVCFFSSKSGNYLVVSPVAELYYQTHLVKFETESEEKLLLPESNHHLDESINRALKSSTGELNVVFFTLDVSVKCSIYSTKKIAKRSQEALREELFGSIIKESDFFFDKFRHLFFNRALHKIQPWSVEELMKVKFVNHVIPYWRI